MHVFVFVFLHVHAFLYVHGLYLSTLTSHKLLCVCVYVCVCVFVCLFWLVSRVPAAVCSATAEPSLPAAGADPVLLLLRGGRPRHLPQQVSRAPVQHLPRLRQPAHRSVLRGPQHRPTMSFMYVFFKGLTLD